MRTEVAFSNRRKHANSFIELKLDVYSSDLTQLSNATPSHICVCISTELKLKIAAIQIESKNDHNDLN